MFTQDKKIQLILCISLSILTLSSVACAWCCGWGNFPIYDEQITGDYTLFAPDEEEQTAIYSKKGQGIEAMVFAYGWNDDFIIAKQHPSVNHFSSTIDESITNWFIIEVATGKVHGPLTEQQFINLRQRLGVPDSLTFTRTIPY